MELVECVPNFSEGGNLKTVDEIARAIEQVPDVYLLDVDSNRSANRTVVTFVGAPKAVCEAAFRAIAVAQSLIDMRAHRGEHPRIGATDVCPLVPLSGVTMTDCIDLSQALARRVARELEIPAYLYAQSAQLPERVRLAYIRKGQYEGLQQRMQKGGFHPDYGPATFNAKSGATAFGARDLLIAFNINLDTKSRKIAEKIAGQIRLARKREQGNAFSRQVAEGGSEKAPSAGEAKFADCTAIGWYIEEYERTQVSMNIMDFRRTPLHRVFLGVKSLAQEHGISVTGSEVVGLVPLHALLEVGRFNLESSKAGSNFPEQYLIDSAIRFLNLSDTKPFEPIKKILDYRLQSLAIP
jgi:glutamate formiminotransferase/formiminotetrahydrofolate cyclodeaminase